MKKGIANLIKKRVKFCDNRSANEKEFVFPKNKLRYASSNCFYGTNFLQMNSIGSNTKNFRRCNVSFLQRLAVIGIFHFSENKT